MRLGLTQYWQIALTLGVVFSSTVNISPSQASVEKSGNKSGKIAEESLVIAKLSVIPEAVSLVKDFEGFRSYSYIDSSGLPVIGYGQTRVNGRTATMGQYITPSQADAALEEELYYIQQLVLAHVKVDLNPYQLSALTSLVYNAGTVIVKDSTLIRKLNAGDYLGAAQEFTRWNKANQGGQLVVYPGLTKRRLAEQKLFLAPYKQVASSN